ncbi:MAG: signal recognition particle-docking protein FtsY [Bdellovibrionales bacterium]|nr:signal recognition particle-docking protein FtsY [Bdellovibrionales bacterium]
MVDFHNSLLEFLKGISNSIGTGDVQGDFTVLVLILVIALGLPLTFLIIRRSSKGGAASNRHSDGFDRLSGIAGRVERFDMNMNSIRTETMRNVEMLKTRVGELEAEIKALRRRVAALDGQTDFSPKTEHFEVPDVEVTERVSLESFSPPEVGTEREESSDSREPVAFDDGFLSPSDAVEQAEKVHERETSEAIRQQRETQEEYEREGKEKKHTLSFGLKKTRIGLFEKLRGVFSSKSRLDEETLEELEALLISADLGVQLVTDLMEELRREVSSGSDISEEKLTSLLKGKILSRLDDDSSAQTAISPKQVEGAPLVVMMVGVNGVGKTTTTAKLAERWKTENAKVLMVAADTFRAAAVKQLQEWGERIGVDVAAGEENAKPSSVVFDAMEQAVEGDFDVVLIDTAGRLHTRTNLMQELQGVRNVIEKHIPGAPHETLLVVDGSTGQNALSQAKEFHSATPLTGLVVTKLDGTPKGGIVVAIKSEVGTPVRYIGVGESAADLREFDANEFVEALFDSSEKTDTDELGAHAKTRRKRRATAGY